VRGPVQLSFARSVEAITVDTHTITRVTDVDKEEGEMGRKHTVAYGLYRAHGFVSANFAAKIGFSARDLSLLWEALRRLFWNDPSSGRSQMTSCKLVAFEHASALGNASAHDLFERVRVDRVSGEDVYAIGDERLNNLPPARRFSDYRVTIDREGLPDGVTIHELL
jgi:CRISPR-associated protein Csd2